MRLALVLQPLELCCLLVLLLQSNEEQKVLEIRCHEQHLCRYSEDKCGGLLLQEKGSIVDETSLEDQSVRYDRFVREHDLVEQLHVGGFYFTLVAYWCHIDKVDNH